MCDFVAASVIGLVLSGCLAPAPENVDLGGGIAIAPDGQILVAGKIQTAPTWMSTSGPQDIAVAPVIAMPPARGFLEPDVAAPRIAGASLELRMPANALSTPKAR